MPGDSEEAQNPESTSEGENTPVAENPPADVADAAPAAVPEQPPERYLSTVVDPHQLQQGMVVRRVSATKIQQGGFVRMNDEGDGLILLNVIDLKNGTFAAEAGVIKPEPGDVLYRHPTRGESASSTEKARQVLARWPLYERHPELKSDMLEFMEISYSGDHVLYLKRHEMLSQLFVPLQERFKIGKHEEKPDYDKMREDAFAEQLLGLYDEKHITYVAFIPTKDTSHKPLFYSIGTKPHIETMKKLEREPFAFKPNRGGHIKIVSPRGEEPRRYVVDAGSNDLGRGMHTSVAVAETVSDALKEFFPDVLFKPLPGRDAFGLQQSW